MRILMDVSACKIAKQQVVSDLVSGQLITPLTQYLNWGGEFAIDNGAFSGFNAAAFAGLLVREAGNRERCLFVAMPDIVGNARRTLELWRYRHDFAMGWPLALVAQDGIEDLDIPWDELHAIFIGGGDPWKDSRAAQDVVRTAKVLRKHVHVGRVNTVRRFRLFAELGADTCDGSGLARYDHMLEDIEREMSAEQPPSLFDGVLDGSVQGVPV